MIRGLITAEITGADIPETLRCITQTGVTLLCTVHKGDLTVQVTLERQDLNRFLRICQKRGDAVKLLHRRGIYWKLRQLTARPVLLAGLVLILAATMYLPSRVLFLEVAGNQRLPARKILETAQEAGIRFGASRRAVRSERIKNILLEQLPELQWAGVNTRGCVAVITVRERNGQNNPPQASGFGHIVALTDAIITSCTATQGTLLCAPGQAVTAGQILISGYTDTGLSIRAQQAAGEIYGQTRRSFQCLMPTFYASTRKTGDHMKKISLLIGKKRINLWKDSGIWDTTCDRMYEEYYITLPGNFRLPLALAVERFAVTDSDQRECSREEAESILSAFAEESLLQTMVAGSIHSCDISFEQQPGILILAGEYRCSECIGIVQRLQIGEENGKNN